MLRGLLDTSSQQHQLDELLGHPASAEVVVKMLTNVCLPALASTAEGGVVGSCQLLQQWVLHACLCHTALALLTEPTLWGRFSPCLQAAGLEACASDSSQLGTQPQRQQDSRAPAQLLDLCRFALAVLAAPQLQPVLARFPASWQEQLQGRACQVARAAFHSLVRPCCLGPCSWHGWASPRWRV